MAEHIWLRCPVCSRDLVALADIPAIRSLAVDCAHCIDLSVRIILERCQPRNPYSPERPEDPQGWRVQSVLAGQQEPAIAGGQPHRRRSRRQARRRKRRHG